MHAERVSTSSTAVESPQQLDFAQRPFIVIWEVTRACALACVHCRAEAIPRRNPGELSFAEGYGLIREIARFGEPPPLLVFTGGDPLWRQDIYDLVEAATAHGLRPSLTPSGTAAVTHEKLVRLTRAGLTRLAVSLDGSTAGVHDAFRGVRGSFNWTLRIVTDARNAGLPVQINTTVSRHNLDDVPALAEMMPGLDPVLWSLFFLVPTGRATGEDQLSPIEAERVLNDVFDLSLHAPFDIKTTEAPHFRRVAIERRQGVRWDGRVSAADTREMTAATDSRDTDRIGRAPKAVNDGNGFVFIDHVGSIYPSGFLPLSAGNVRSEGLVETYGSHQLFVALRDPDRLRGRCGRCEYRAVCGGSRARAYAVFDDPLAEDPLCGYDPPAARG
jgi:radical SAM protein